MNDPIAITGIGLVTPAGTGTGATWRGLLAGRSTARRHPGLAGLPVDFCCAVPDLDANKRLTPKLALRLDRFTQMAIIAAREAAHDADLGPASYDPTRIAVVIGTGCTSLERYESYYGHLLNGHYRKISPLCIPRSIPNISAGEVAIDLHAQGPCLTTCTACASGATAIGTAKTLLDTGQCDVALAGGTESVCNRMSSAAFCQLGALSTRIQNPETASRPFDADRDGFVLAEGAGILVLERAADATARRHAPYAYLTGYGASCDAHHITALSAHGVTNAIRSALRDAGLQPGDVDHVNAHGTSTQFNDQTEASVFQKLFPHNPPVTSFKGTIGHSIGGAGAIEAAGAALTLKHHTIPPTANHHRPGPGIAIDLVTGVPRTADSLKTVVSTSFGFGGQNAVLVLTSA
ncbi:beta-ketoacyl-[acyl-carrier-protein] synthase family protein [Streptomyces sp. PTM05]|uniref:Beta-ketoacyl-[acyl-carrier-protein] synthase family protein n=1 Tax=Streptantibioticus parmotrematis TaxID=2873249 RepID=A0ABS7QTN7_9ACTN|nr:beta-ketoacyl-[acyl-carrier-protein] synthase family protein [Streptantibioticus parmotrematis]MBY8886096.1 beta-ketoacyl-[acyl-carrier-protein] synthase family protein [Streptantibioticus parmotrematis]